LKGVWRVTMVTFKEVGQRLAFLEGDQGQQDVAGQREIQRGVGFAMAVTVFLPGTGVAFVMVAVFHRPVPAHRRRAARLIAGVEAGEKEAGVTFTGLKRVFLLRPIALDGDGRTGTRQSGVDGGNGGDATPATVQSPVFALLAQCKRGVSLRACVAPASRLAVFFLVPMR